MHASQSLTQHVLKERERDAKYVMAGERHIQQTQY